MLMKLKMVLVIFFIGAALVTGMPAMAYTIDGDLSDWGLSKLNSGDWSENETWIPAEGISFVIEDNMNPRLAMDYQGVHIWGENNSWNFYDEPQRIHSITKEQWNDPYGGEEYDMEAFYFDQDSDSIYMAIVTSLPPDGTGDTCPNDLALNFGSNPVLDDLGYEYGIILRDDTTQGSIILNPVWKKSGDFLAAKPDSILENTGSCVGLADISYNNNWLIRQDNGFANYVIEIGVRKSDVGVIGDIHSNNMFYGDSSMDEYIFTPEFPSIAVSLAILIGIIFIVYVLWERDGSGDC